MSKAYHRPIVGPCSVSLEILGITLYLHTDPADLRAPCSYISVAKYYCITNRASQHSLYSQILSIRNLKRAVKTST